MVDRYTKTVLTVIALALCALVAQNFAPRAYAQLGGECGAMRTPCYIATGLSPISVRIER